MATIDELTIKIDSDIKGAMSGIRKVDSAVDHIEQYWMGGKTIPENARLTHRFCNWSRPRKEEGA